MSDITPSPPPGSFAKLMAVTPKTSLPVEKQKSEAATPAKHDILIVQSPIRKTGDLAAGHSIHVHKKTSTHVHKQANMYTGKHVYIKKCLAFKPVATTTFRLPPEILAKFDEVYYLIKSRYKSKAKRYAIVIAALALLFWDFETHGKDSDLYKLVVKDNK